MTATRISLTFPIFQIMQIYTNLSVAIKKLLNTFKSNLKHQLYSFFSKASRDNFLF